MIDIQFKVYVLYALSEKERKREREREGDREREEVSHVSTNSQDGFGTRLLI